MEQKILLNIDNKTVEAHSGMTILDAALAADLYIPHLCHHPNLKDVGECKMCVVEIEGREGVSTSCTTLAEEGMVIKTKTDKLKHLRNLSMELMLASHPSECTSCTKYLKCELQNLIQYLGVSDARMRKLPMVHPVRTENPLFVRDMNRCILCGRCVRACRELRGCEVLDYVKEGEKTYIGTEHGGLLAEDHCRFCTACVEVCPTGALMDKTEALSKFPKAEENLLPCKASCPAGTDAHRYVRYIKEGKYPEAVAVIRQRAPFPLTLGYICTAFCEKNCRRGDVNTGSAVAIRELKKFAALHDNGLWRSNEMMAPSTGKRVAVIGSGPAGLTAAYYLTKKGHAVTVYEKLSSPGGMMRVGIPKYRLPREVFEAEIKEMERVGVKISINSEIKAPSNLLAEGYDAVVAAIGAHKGIRLPIEGNNLPNVLVNTDFLRDISLDHEVKLGKRVIVLGGGNVAFDCARSARRLGADKVMLACLEDRSQMTASRDEIEEGIEEGIEIINSRTFLKIISDEKGTGVVCEEVEAFQFDENGKLQLQVKLDSIHTIYGDTVIFATGQIVDIPGEFGLTTGRGNRIVVNGFETEQKGVFAAGDAITGTLSVIHGIASGRGVAEAVDKYLGGDGNISEVLVPPEEPKHFIGREERFAYNARRVAVQKPPQERICNFEEAVEAFDKTSANMESGRCLQCDLRLKLKKVKFWGDYSHR